MDKMIRKFKSYFCLLVFMVAIGANVSGQVITYSESFTNAATSNPQCNVWETFRASLLLYSYSSVSVTAGSPATTITCTNPTIVADIALHLRTGVAKTWLDGSNTWNVGLCGSGGSPVVSGWELSVNNSGNCACGAGYCVRPCIGNSNWGGQGTTCSGVSQTLTVVFNAGPPCPVPSALTMNTVYSTSASFSWTGPSQTSGYEYIVNTTATGPTSLAVPPGGSVTSAPSGSVTGLTPSTAYYLHVRNKCDSPSKSVWVSIPFTTLPPCIVQPKFQVPYLDSSSATISWQSSVTALDFKYIVSTNSTFPTSTTGASTTSVNSFSINQLTPGTVYYVFVMARCIGGDSSGWVIDSFYVPIPCRAPTVQFIDGNDSRVIAYWTPPLAAESYELINSKVAISNPVSGIKLSNPSYLLPYLDPNTLYFVYTRTYCNDKGIHTISPWSAASYNTWPLAVGEVQVDAAINIHPNPVGSEMIITIGTATNKNGVISILDMTGKVLKSQPVTGNKTTVSVAELSAGIYIAQYTSEDSREQARFYKE